MHYLDRFRSILLSVPFKKAYVIAFWQLILSKIASLTTRLKANFIELKRGLIKAGSKDVTVLLIVLAQWTSVRRRL